MKHLLRICSVIVAFLIVILVGMNSPLLFGRAAGPWYVTPLGNDTNACDTPALPCKTITGPMNKPQFVSGDTINVATGVYSATTGSEVVLLGSSAVLSGGWNGVFTHQDGMSTIDGGSARRGVTVNSGQGVSMERFIVQNGSAPGCAGILNSGALTMQIVVIRNNTGAGGDGGGLCNDGALTLTGSQVTGNQATNGGAISNAGNLTLNNTTISNNIADTSGGGIYVSSSGGIVNANNATIVSNIANSGGGIYHSAGSVTIRNTILAENISYSAADCSGAIISAGYNLLGNTSGCTFTPVTGDITNLSPTLGPLVGSPGYHYLSPGSPARDAGNPALPGSGGNACLLTDQRGVPRSGRCDIGAYEYILPGPAAKMTILSAASQRTAPNAAFDDRMVLAVLDANGSPAGNIPVTFAAPSSGSSAIFSSSGTVTATVLTDPSGFVAAPEFRANGIPGAFTISASAGAPGVSVTFDLFIDPPWYATATGNDANDCHTPATSCATVAGVFAKASFADGDVVLLGAGTYTGAGSAALRLDKSTRIWGGWDPVFHFAIRLNRSLMANLRDLASL